MEIKEMFKKYFRSPMAKMILNNGSTKDANKFLLEQMLSSKGGDLIVKYNSKNASDVSYIRLDETNVENAFRSNAWSNMSLEDRVKSINLMIKKCEKNMGIKKPIALTVIPREDIPDNKFTTAFYADGYNEIFLYMDRLEKVNGPRMFNTLVHECTHAKDYQTIKSVIIPKLLSTCCNDTTKNPTSLIVGDQIININIDGVLDNKSGGQNIRITPGIRQEILMAKNIFAVCENKGVDSLDKVKSKDDYEKYVETIMYYASPLERSARVNALIETNKMIEKEMRVGVSSGDIQYLKAINNSEKYIDTEIAKAGQLFGNSINDTFDIFCKYHFYNDNFDTLNKMSTTRKSVHTHIKPATKDYVDNIVSCYYKIDKELGE